MSVVDTIRLLIVDDHTLFREGLARLLAGEPSLEVLGSVGGIDEALRAMRLARPDVILLDLDLGTERGLDLLLHPEVVGTGIKVLVVTAGTSRLEFDAMRQAGGSGLVHKGSSPDKLLEAIRRVASGETHVENPAAIHPAEDRTKLSDREVRITRLITRGMSNKEIADELAVAESTVKAALRVLFGKVGVRTRSQLVRVALEQYRDLL